MVVMFAILLTMLVNNEIEVTPSHPYLRLD